jgi:hypothetical protein
VDLALMYGLDWAEAFRPAYEARTGEELVDLWFWDLLRAEHAHDSLHYFFEGYRDLRLPDLTLPVLAKRLDGFIEDALRRVPRA